VMTNNSFIIYRRKQCNMSEYLATGSASAETLKQNAPSEACVARGLREQNEHCGIVV
jgi:hypothetical protein